MKMIPPELLNVSSEVYVANTVESLLCSMCRSSEQAVCGKISEEP